MRGILVQCGGKRHLFCNSAVVIARSSAITLKIYLHVDRLCILCCAVPGSTLFDHVWDVPNTTLTMVTNSQSCNSNHTPNLSNPVQSVPGLATTLQVQLYHYTPHFNSRFQSHYATTRPTLTSDVQLEHLYSLVRAALQKLLLNCNMLLIYFPYIPFRSESHLGHFALIIP